MTQVERIASTSLQDVLEKVQPEIAAGAVNVISVDAIRQRSGDRWPSKRETVEDFVERTFSRLSRPGDLMVALNEAEFVTIQPGAPRTTALSVSASVLKETLAFFLGKAAREDLALFQVTSFRDGALGVQAVVGAMLDQAFDPESRAAAPAADVGVRIRSASIAPPSNDLYWTRVRRTRLISPPDLEVDLDISPEPTWNVGGKVVASFLLRPCITLVGAATGGAPAVSGDLSPNMAGEAARAMIAYAVEMIEQRGVGVALHVPIALNAISYSTSRFRILNTLRELSPRVRRLLILEVVGISEGLPQSRLAEVVAMLGPNCRAVLARAPSELTDVRPWRGCGLSGVSLDCGHIDPADRTAQERLGGFARRAAAASLSCAGYELPSRSLMLAAWASGFTHVGGPHLTAEMGSPRAIRRMRPTDLFSRPEAR